MGKTATTQHKKDTILVLDFGGQYTHLISRAVQANMVNSMIVDCRVTPQEVRELGSSGNIRGIILSGGPDSVYDANAPLFDKGILELGIPVLGLCYGHQLLAQESGGRVEGLARKEYGHAVATIDNPSGLLRGLNHQESVWMSHGDSVTELPEGFEAIAHTENTAIAAFRHKTKPIFGLQWHLEVAHTEHGEQMLRNFIFGECKCKPEGVREDFIEKAVAEIREKIGNGKAAIALSGGVDSSVMAALAGKAIGDRAVIVYVDTGLMREGETEQIVQTFSDIRIKLNVVNASDRFFAALKGITDPEKKRKVIGELFIRVFEEVAKEAEVTFLLQGTIYPDRVESGATGRAAVIKTHHNVGGIPKKSIFRGKIVEPLRDLYKYEVRELAKELGLPSTIASRQPFPGPGLAVRIIGDVTREKAEIVRKADHIVTEELESAGIPNLQQYFAVLTDTLATGVKGDGRAYGHTVAIRAVETRDFMTANFVRLPWDVIEKISSRITNEIRGVTRVVYDVTNKPPATVEWE